MNWMRWARAVAIAASALAALSCSSSSRVDLLVDVKTDLVPGLEFARLRAELFDHIPDFSEAAPFKGVRERAAQAGEAFDRGVRAAEYTGIHEGTHVVRLRLVGFDNEIIVERIALLTLRKTSVFTLVLTRDCRGKACPGPDDDPSFIACVGGRCVSPKCTPETLEFCPAFSCDVGISCIARVACAQPRCSTENVCLRVANPSLCPTGQLCDPDTGCVPADVLSDGAVSDSAIADAGTSDSAVATIPWGQWAASLAVPPCPVAPILTVDTTTLDLEGGDTTLSDPAQAGPTLSFAEALWISANRAGPDTIEFDPSIFPVESPARIVVDASSAPLIAFQTDACIDARGRGVIVDWAPDSVGNIWQLGAGSLMVGLTLLSPPVELDVIGAQVAGCRIATDGVRALTSTLRFWSVNVLGGATLGPGNVIVAMSEGIRVQASSTIRGNYFGYDPLTRLQIPLGSAANIRPFTGNVTFDSNVIATTATVLSTPTSPSAVVLAFRNNRIGISPDDLLFVRPRPGLELSNLSGVVDRNVIRTTTEGVWITEAVLELRQNSIQSELAPIRHSTPPFPPPTIDAAGSTMAQGTCAVDGTVEVFHGAGGQPEMYVGSAACMAGAWSLSWGSALPSGSVLTATLTDATPQTSELSVPWTL